MVVTRRKDRTQVLRVIPRVVITNTDAAIIEHSCDILGRLNIGKWVHKTKPNNTGLVKHSSKDITYIEVSGFKRMQRLLKAIIPHMRSAKKQRAEILLRFITRRFEKADMRDIAANYRYDDEDVGLMLQFLMLTKSKNIDGISRMLNEYVVSTRNQYTRVKRDSELTRNRKSLAEMSAAA